MPLIQRNMSTAEAYKGVTKKLSKLDSEGSRIGGMKEELGALITIADPRQRYVFRDDKWNLAFQLQEHWAYWAGANPGHVQRYNTQMKEWMVDGELPGSAYGDRLRNTAGHDQIERAMDQIRERPQTRRAMMMVHQPSVEDYSGGDVACTGYLHPFVRDGELHMIASLRSQDMYWGYTYDAANNQFVQEVMAAELGYDIGEYWHFMDSCHYYTDFEEQVVASQKTATPATGPALELPDGRSWEHEFEWLTLGLESARMAYTDGVHDVLDSLETRFASDWLKVMTAYELARFHDDPQHGQMFARDIVNNDWGGWTEEYIKGKL